MWIKSKSRFWAKELQKRIDSSTLLQKGVQKSEIKRIPQSWRICLYFDEITQWIKLFLELKVIMKIWNIFYIFKFRIERRPGLMMNENDANRDWHSNAAFSFEKRVPFSGLQKRMAPRCVWPWGIQIGFFAVQETHFCIMDFHFINRPHAAFPFSCIQRKGHPSVDHKSDWHQGVYDPGAFKLDHLLSKKPIFA